MLKSIHHIAIICSDIERSKKFYTEILPFQIIREIYRQERLSWKIDLSLNHQYTIELFSFPDAPERPSFPEAQGLRHLAFETDDIESEHALLKSKHVAVESIRTDEYTGKKFFFFSDPDGLPLEIYQS
jgi:glyoxylase I family protein